MPAMFKNTLSICLSYISEINFHPRHVSASVFLKLIIFSFLPRDPDSVVLCLLAADDGDDADDVALQIHFTLLQSFCCDSGITILRVSGIQCLKQLLGAVNANRNQEELRDLHCMLVTVCWLSTTALSYVTARPKWKCIIAGYVHPVT